MFINSKTESHKNECLYIFQKQQKVYYFEFFLASAILL